MTRNPAGRNKRLTSVPGSFSSGRFPAMKTNKPGSSMKAFPAASMKGSPNSRSWRQGRGYMPGDEEEAFAAVGDSSGDSPDDLPGQSLSHLRPKTPFCLPPPHQHHPAWSSNGVDPGGPLNRFQGIA
jgi:hypothetical protein